MAERAEVMYFTPQTEAKRLWDGAQEAIQNAGQDIVSLSEAVDLGARVVEIAMSQRLKELRNKFPATITILLDPSPPEVEVERDFVHPPKALQFIDAVDLLSDAGLSCISRKLHHGWVDPVASCRESRALAKKACGISVDRNQRDALMLLGAYRNRIFRLPPPVRVVTDEVLTAFPTLAEVVERLLRDG